MYEKQVRDLSFITLVADAHCLGTHWIYEEKDLKQDNINWHELSNARAVWHKGKQAGAFTHYGDQLYFLYKFLEDKNSFDLEEYMSYWLKKMSVYNGYIDGATKDTIKNLEDKKNIPCGSSSHDLSVASRIWPLLKVSKDKEEFLKNVTSLVKATHDNASVLEASLFFANLLLEVLETKDIKSAILSLKDKYSSVVQNYVQEAIDRENDDTFTSLSSFGTSCSVEGGFRGVIYILNKYNNLEEALVNNAKAGGDNSSRAMIIAPLMLAQNPLAKISQNLTKLKVTI